MEHKLFGQVALKNRPPISLAEKEEGMQIISFKNVTRVPSCRAPQWPIHPAIRRGVRAGPKRNKAHGEPWALLDVIPKSTRLSADDRDDRRRAAPHRAVGPAGAVPEVEGPAGAGVAEPVVGVVAASEVRGRTAVGPGAVASVVNRDQIVADLDLDAAAVRGLTVAAAVAVAACGRIALDPGWGAAVAVHGRIAVGQGVADPVARHD